MIDENLKAAAKEATKVSPSVTMRSVEDIHPPQDETIVAQKFKVKPSPPRSPAPLPEPVSPAGVPVTVDLGPKATPTPALSESPTRKTIASPLPDGEVKIEVTGLEDLDLSMEGKNSSEYIRNKKATGIVALLLFIGINLLVFHVFMFAWVVEFSSSKMAVAAVFYFISTFFVLGTLAASLVKPSFSIGDPDSLYKCYFLIAVAGLLDLLAILIGGSIFGPFIIHSTISTSYLNMNTIAIILSVALNAGLFIGFTRPEGNACAKYFHPFESIRSAQSGETEFEGGTDAQEDKTAENESVV